MSETALWLIYGLSGIVAFLTVYLWRWRVVPSLLAGTAVSLTLYLLLSFAFGARLDDPWLEAALIINGSFALVMAGGGTVAAFAIRAAARDD